MVKLTEVLCVLVGLLAVAIAAPVAEENSPKPDAIKIIDGADPIENDITGPPNTENEDIKTITEHLDENATAGEIIPLKDQEVVHADEPEIAEKVEEKPTEIIEAPINDEIIDTEMPVEPIEIIEEENTDIIDQDGRIPVDEVIPAPKVAFVLGVDAEDITDGTSYQIVQGETEEGTPVLSEMAPEGVFGTDEEDGSMIPIAEPALHEYPLEEIIPEADFHPEETMGPEGAPDLAIGTDAENDAPLDDIMPVNDDAPMDGPSEMENDYERPVDFAFVGPLHYPTDLPPGHFDDSFHYDTRDNLFMPGPVMNADLSPVDYQEMRDDFQHPDMGEMRPQFDHITAGLEQNFHPDLKSGFNPHPEEQANGPEANYPVYNNEPIIPGAMLSSNTPMVEGIHNVDTPVPERVLMDDSLETDKAMQGDEIPDMKYQESNNDDFKSQYDQEIDFILPGEAVDADDKPNLVMELSLKRQELSVNGYPFELSQAPNIFKFVAELISGMNPKPKISDINEINEQFNNEFTVLDMSMPQDLPYRQLDTPYPNIFPSNEDVTYYGNSFYPPGHNFDNSPYYYPIKPFFNHMMKARFNNMRDNVYHNRFAFETPRERRFAFNPIWY